MTYSALLSRLLVGWQKVAEMYNMPVQVFQTGDTYLAVSNEAQGLGHLVQILGPRGASGNSATIPMSGRTKSSSTPSAFRIDGPSRVGHFWLDLRASST